MMTGADGGRGNMVENLVLVAEQVGVLFLLISVGFVLRKMKWMDDRAASQLSQLLLYVVGCCAIINALQVPFSMELLMALLWGLLFLGLQYGVLIVISMFTFRKAPPETRSVLRYAQVYANNLFMGLPLVQAVLGDAAVIFVAPSLAAYQIFSWTHGVSMMGGRLSLKRAVINPGIISVAVGFALFMARIMLPVVPARAVEYFSSMNTPLAMMIIGIQMAGADLKSTFTNLKLYGVAFVKLIVSPAVTLLIMLPCLKIDPNMFCALVILAAAPTAGVTSILAQQFRQDTAAAAQIISLTTLLSLFTLPVFAVIAKTIAF